MKQFFRKLVLPSAAAVVLALSGTMAIAHEDDDDDRGSRTLTARLSGFNEIPSILVTDGKGTFKAKIDKVTGKIDYELSYDGLQGTVTQAHIHLGREFNTGQITIWLCQTASNPAPPSVSATTPTCPDPSGTVTGTISADSVLAAPNHFVETGNLDEVLAAIRAKAAYVNVHTKTNTATGLPGVGSGEMRGQVSSHR